MMENIALYFYSAFAQVWAAIVVFAALVLRESVRFHIDRMELCFQLTVRDLIILKDKFEIYHIEEAKGIFDNQENMHAFLNRKDIDEVFNRVPSDSMLNPTERDKEAKRSIASAKARNSAYFRHKKMGKESAAKLRFLFVGGIALVSVSLILISVADYVSKSSCLFYFTTGLLISISFYLVYEILPAIADERPAA